MTESLRGRLSRREQLLVIALVLAVVVAASQFAQNRELQSRLDSIEPLLAEVKVYDARTGERLSEVRFRFPGAYGGRAMIGSADDGYSIAWASSDPVEFEVSAEGYAPETVRISEGAERADVRLEPVGGNRE